MSTSDTTDRDLRAKLVRRGRPRTGTSTQDQADRNHARAGDTLPGTTLAGSRETTPPLRTLSLMQATNSPPGPSNPTSTVIVRSTVRGTSSKRYVPMEQPELAIAPTRFTQQTSIAEVSDEPDTPEQSMRTLRWVEKEARRLLKIEEEKVDAKPTPMAHYLNQIIKSQEAQVKVRAELRKKESGMPAEWDEIRDRIMGALQPYPSALKAVIEALGK